MCFYSDPDWACAVETDEDIVCDRHTYCNECGRDIGIGATYKHIHQQEHEECQTCYDGDCECPRDAEGELTCDGGAACQCNDPCFGETFEYDVCQDCQDFLKAVQSAEIEAGCDLAESKPPLSAMVESICEGGRNEAKKYWAKAVTMFPKKKPFFGWLWRRIFE